MAHDDPTRPLIERFRDEVNEAGPGLATVLRDLGSSAPGAEELGHRYQHLAQLLHKWKGDSSLLGLTSASTLMSRMEAVVLPYHDGGEQLPPSVSALLLAAFEAFQAEVSAAAGHTKPSANFDRVLQQLARHKQS